MKSGSSPTCTRIPKKVSKYLMISEFRNIKGILVANLHLIRMLLIHLKNCCKILNPKMQNNDESLRRFHFTK